MTSSVTAPAFEDLSVGDEAPPLVVENISRTHFVRYAGASGDFKDLPFTAWPSCARCCGAMPVPR